MWISFDVSSGGKSENENLKLNDFNSIRYKL